MPEPVERFRVDHAFALERPQAALGYAQIGQIVGFMLGQPAMGTDSIEPMASATAVPAEFEGNNSLHLAAGAQAEPERAQAEHHQKESAEDSNENTGGFHGRSRMGISSESLPADRYNLILANGGGFDGGFDSVGLFFLANGMWTIAVEIRSPGKPPVQSSCVKLGLRP
jgi:hypothetical protein